MDGHGQVDPTQQTIMFVHGIDSQRTPDVWVGLADRLTKLGYNVLMFDLLRVEGPNKSGRRGRLRDPLG